MIKSKNNKKKGRGILNSLISSLPVELHIAGYSYCSPGTKLEERLKRGNKPKNKLDEYCKQHDIFYHNNPDTESRNKADLVLADHAWERVKSWDASIGERAAAYAVMNAMKAKAKIGMGKSKNIKMDNFELLKRARNIRGVFMGDELKRQKVRKVENAIINLDTSHNKGTHWVAYKKRGNLAIYFDPFGIQPPKEVMKYFNCKILYNTKQIQNLNSSKCGEFCINFINNKNTKWNHLL